MVRPANGYRDEKSRRHVKHAHQEDRSKSWPMHDLDEGTHLRLRRPSSHCTSVPAKEDPLPVDPVACACFSTRAVHFLRMCSEWFKWVQVGSDRFKWIQMGKDESKWVQMGSDGFRWVQIGSDRFRWVQVGSDRFRWIQMCSDVFRCVQMGSDGFR